jgi:CheY-like chemotaxis protein
MIKKEGKKILIVDDNDINQLVVKKVLERQGFFCDLANNGEEAVSAVKKERYECILMDCQMPVLDGYEATKIIRRVEVDTRSRIIAMTANALHGDREKCLESGMDDYLSKPIDFEKMIRLINNN